MTQPLSQLLRRLFRGAATPPEAAPPIDTPPPDAPPPGTATSAPPPRSVGVSHPGRRANNEDAFLERPDLGLWVVADGMGGGEAGELASGLIVSTLNALSPPPGEGPPTAAVRDALAEVDSALQAEAERRDGAIIGSTVVALLLTPDEAVCLWAGDSRMYLWRGGRLSRISHDHSKVQEMIDAGLLDPAAAERHPLANQITKVIGVAGSAGLDEARLVPLADDLFLLCSDGVTKPLDDAAIAGVLATLPWPEIPEALVRAALEAGGRDNITAVAVAIPPVAATGDDDTVKKTRTPAPASPPASAGDEVRLALPDPPRHPAPFAALFAPFPGQPCSVNERCL